MQGVVDPLIKALSRYHVVDLNSREADLEDTFLAAATSTRSWRSACR